jgi:uncharacterized protein YegL
LFFIWGAVAVYAQPAPSIDVVVEANPPFGVTVGEGVVEVTLRLVPNVGVCPPSANSRPVDVVLVADVSGSMAGDPLEVTKQAMVRFVRSVNFSRPPQRGGDQVGLVTFSSTASLVLNLTQNIRDLERAINELSAGGGTDIAAGLRVGTDAVNSPQYENTTANAQPVIVLLSDGISDLDAAIEASRRAIATGARVVTVGLGADADLSLLRQIASSPSDFYDASDITQLSSIYENIAQRIVPTTAARDVQLSYQYDREAFELLPDSIYPPATVQGDIIRWTYGQIDSGTEPTFTFRVRPTQLGSRELGRIVESNYLYCDDNQNRIPLTGGAMFIQAISPTPTPLPSATPTPLPSPTPLPPTPVVSETSAEQYQPVQTAQASFGFGLLAFCEDIWQLFPWLLAALLVIALLAWTISQARRTDENKPSLWCFISRLLLFTYAAFVIWLFALPLFMTTCPKRDAVFFWGNTTSADRQTTAIYVVPQGSDSVTTFDVANRQGCVGCHTVSADGSRLALILVDPNNADARSLQVYDTSGRVVRLQRPVPATFVSLSPDGRRAVVATPEGDLSIVDFATGSVSTLAGADNPNLVETMPSWGVNGRIAFVVTSDISSGNNWAINSPTQIYTVPEGGGTPQLLVAEGVNSNNTFNYYPSYSPDGRWLAFTSHSNRTTYADEQAQIYLMPSEGGVSFPINANFGANGEVLSGASSSWATWSRDGRFLTFNAKRNGVDYDVYIAEVGADGTTTTARPLAGASQTAVFEHNAAWGQPPAVIDLLAQWQELLPWLLPLLPLAFLAWWLCRRRPEETIEREELRVRVVSGQSNPLPLDLKPFSVKWEPQPTLVVGLGTTGRWVLTHLKKDLLDAGNTKELKDVALLCVDIGDYTRLVQDDETVAVRFAGVALDSAETLEIKNNLRALADEAGLDRERLYRGWLDQSQLRGEQLDLTQGASQRRVLARAGALWQMQTEKDNLWTRTKAHVKQMLAKDNTRLNLVIVGDAYSDAGSAILMDVAMLAQKAARELNSNVGFNIVSYVVMRKESDTDGANTVATLREISRYQLAEGRPFRVYYERILDESGNPNTFEIVCDSVPFEDVVLYDVERGDWRNGLYPMIADAVLMRLDKANTRADLSLQSDKPMGVEIEAMKTARGKQFQVIVSNEVTFQLRLPYRDLMDNIKQRYVQEVLRVLLSERQGKDVYGSGIQRADVLAMSLINGQLGVAPSPDDILLVLEEALKNNPGKETLTRRLKNVREGEQTGVVMRQRLQAALKLILNGSGNAADMRVARGGKLQDARDFLKEVPSAVMRAQQVLEGQSEPAAQQILDGLAELLESVKTYDKVLESLAKSTGVERGTESKPTLLEEARKGSTNLVAYRQAMDKLASRKYYWENAKGQLLADVWYEEYLFPNINASLGQFYWEVGETNIALTLTALQASRVVYEPSAPEPIINSLRDIAEGYCGKIDASNLLVSYLENEQKVWKDGKLTASLVGDMVRSAPFLLPFDDTSVKSAPRFILNGNKELQERTDEKGKTLRDHLIEMSQTKDANESVLRAFATNPFIVGFKRRQATIPMDGVLSYGSYKEIYMQNHQLGGETVSRSVTPTAVYEAEAQALRLEARFVREVNMRYHTLNEITAIGLTEPRRAQAFLLMLGAGEIGVQGPRAGVAPNEVYSVELYTQELEGVIKTPLKFFNEKLHPIIQAYLTLVYDRETFTDAFIEEVLARYRTDDVLRDIWRKWLRDGWQQLLGEVDKNDLLNYGIMRDLTAIARLWIQDFANNNSGGKRL